MNIVAFVPARSGSKSIKDKNIKLLGGKPLLAWSIESAQKCGLQTIVNTDSKEYAKIAEEYGAEVMMRPVELGQDNTSMFELLKNEVPKIEADVILLLQPTSPFRELLHIKAAISYFTENLNKYDSLISVETVPEKYNPAQVIINTPSGKKMASGVPISKRLTRRQDFPEAYIPDGSIYLFKASNLQEGSIYGKEVMLYENEGTLNINTEEDWSLAEQQIQK